MQPKTRYPYTRFNLSPAPRRKIRGNFLLKGNILLVTNKSNKKIFYLFIALLCVYIEIILIFAPTN